jgi:hypothetical protein
LHGGAGWQVVLLVAAWIYLSGLHFSNDGLWFQGDAPRHAANGLFWKDFVLRLPSDPKGYALSYYARYPVIYPTAYPPAFYLLEGGAFALLGPSPEVAKGLVLGSALLAGLYTLAWLRRWVAPEAGWAAALVLLSPGVVLWSHAVMLNVPATALSFAALYHTRRRLEQPAVGARRHLGAAVVLTVLALLTYYPAGVVLAIGAAWALALGGWRVLFSRRALALAAGFVLLAVPCLLVAGRWAPTQLEHANPLAAEARTAANWTFYPSGLPELFRPDLLGLAAGGILLGLWTRRWRRETLLLLTWLAVTYVVFSCLPAKATRYVLPLGLPLVCLAAIALVGLGEGIGAALKARAELGKAAAVASLLVLLAVHARLAAQVRVPSVTGFRQVVEFVEHAAPDEPILYAGYYDGVFTFYLQANDPGYRRRVVLSRKLLFVPTARIEDAAMASTVGLLTSPHGAGPLEAATGLYPGRGRPVIMDVLQTRGGCRWIVIEQSAAGRPGGPTWGLRAAVQGPQFEFVRSFPIWGADIDHVDVYRLLAPVQCTDEVEIGLPALGESEHQRVRPIPTRPEIPDGGA